MATTIDFNIDEIRRFSLGVYQYKKKLFCIGCGTDIGEWFIDEKHHLPLCNDCRNEYEEYTNKAST